MKCVCGEEIPRKYDVPLFHCPTCKHWYKVGEDGVFLSLRTRDAALELLRNGYSPSKISREMDITSISVMQYLLYQIGEGEIRRSDVIFTIDPTIRNQIEGLIATEADKFYPSDIIKKMKSSGASIDTDDAAAYLDLRNARLAFGDMYEYIRESELTIHTVVKWTLIAKYGMENWWRKGVPETIRGDLASEREKDPMPAAEPYCYTSIVQLREIIKTQWSIFQDVFPKKLTVDRKSFLDGLLRLNQIRRLVMHPSRGENPTTDDFAFVRALRKHLSDVESYGSLEEAWKALGYTKSDKTPTAAHTTS